MSDMFPAVSYLQYVLKKNPTAHLHLQITSSICVGKCDFFRLRGMKGEPSQSLVCVFFLFTQGRCSRENCKYLHPPSHLKTQLEINGRNNLIQQKTAAAVLAQQMQLMIPGPSLQPVVEEIFFRYMLFASFWFSDSDFQALITWCVCVGGEYTLLQVILLPLISL